MGGFRFMHKRNFSVRTVSYLALLTAMEIVLNRFLSVNTAGLKIGFAFVPVVVAAALFGPTSAAIVGGLSDLLGAILFPIGPYHPGFTVCAALSGAVYGWSLHRPDSDIGKTPFFPNIVLPSVINNIGFGLLVNTVWVATLYGSRTYFGWFMYRLSEYVVMIPVNLCLIPVLLRLCGELGKIARKQERKVKKL